MLGLDGPSNFPLNGTLDANLCIDAKLTEKGPLILILLTRCMLMQSYISILIKLLFYNIYLYSLNEKVYDIYKYKRMRRYKKTLLKVPSICSTSYQKQ